MAVKIRLQRHGRKDYAYYHIVVADSKAPRDGRFIERIGSYNPNTNPATIDIDLESSLKWLNNGAQPTDTCKAILSYKGVLLKKHLLEGVKKGALTNEQAEAKFDQWLKSKESKIQAKKDQISLKIKDGKKQTLASEAKAREAHAQKIAEKQAQLAAKATEANQETAEPEA
jgi:small subunit ribosomal protein S16